MTTVEHVARGVLAAVASQAGHLLAAKWVAGRYQQMCGVRRFRHLRRVGELVVPAAITAGTVTFTQDGLAVTGNAAARAAWVPMTESLNAGQWAIQPAGSAVWYAVAGRSDQDLRLASPSVEATVAGSGYMLLRRWHPLTEDARTVTVVAHPRLRRPLDVISRLELERRAAGRSATGTPVVWADVDPTVEGVRQIETYPYSTVRELLTYVYYAHPTALRLTSPIPAGVDPIRLQEGALVDAFRFEMARALRGGQTEAATVWRNEMRTQETRWEQAVQREAAASDMPADDVSFLLLSRTPASASTIVTAADHVWSRY